MDRREATWFNEVAVSQIKTRVPPALTVFAILYAVTIGLINLALVVGGPLDMVVSGIDRHVHLATWRGPEVAPFMLGLFMLFLATQLRLRKRAALFVFSSFLIVQALVDLSRGMSHFLGVSNVLVGVLLLLAIKEMPAQPDPVSFRQLKVVFPALAVVFFAFGMTVITLYHRTLGVSDKGLFAIAYRTVTVAVGESGLNFHGWALVFEDLLGIILAFGLVLAGYLLFRPYREAVGQSAADHQRAVALMRSYGTDSLAYFNLRRDKELFFYGDDMFIAYRRVGSIAVISGDPVGPPELIPEALSIFREFCLERGWRQMSLGARDDYMRFYEEAGFKGLLIGEEAVLHLDEFSLDGRPVRKLRQSVNKMRREGYSMEFMYNSGIPSHVKHELATISAEWRGDKSETGFSMGLGRLMDDEDPDCLLCLAYDGEMRPVGFLYMVPMYPRQGYSLDITRTMIDAPNALSEFMLASSALFLKEHGYRQMSMHFLALSQHYREDRDEPGSPMMRALARGLSHVVPVVTAYNFDKKFFPRWKPRCLLYQSALDLPAVALTAFTVESALKVARPADRKHATAGR